MTAKGHLRQFFTTKNPAVFVDKIGSFRIENITPARIAELLDGALK